MANKDDYLTVYRQFFEFFAETVNPNDQLPVKLASYKFVNLEVVGGIIDWTTQYLNQKKCPQSLIAPLIKIVIEEIRKACKKQPVVCGFNPSDNAYEPLKLMQTVMAKTNEVCLRYLDNSMLCSLPAPGPPNNIVSVCAVKNRRRCMEDRHVVIHDLNTMFNIQEASPSSYYAIFDGHAGHDAAAYSAAHLHQYLAESKHYVSNPTQALQDAFCKTDALFIEKCKVEHFSSGTTAVCALHRPKEKSLYIAWVGDSQALLANQGKVLQCVEPHKPCREDEKNRIEQQGGSVLYWGTWRVNGQLAVSRAIGDTVYKPYVTAIPDVQEIPLTGSEDFLIIACDGLWDFLSEDDAARTVYKMICQNPDDTESISQRLVQKSKENGSTDNISVIVVFLREPSKIAAEGRWAKGPVTMEAGLDNSNAANPFANSNGTDILNLNEGFKQNGTNKEFFTEKSNANGKRLSSEFDEDDDMGPETDVDAVDDVLLSPNIVPSKTVPDAAVNNNPMAFNPFESIEKIDTDAEIQKQQSSEFDAERSPREETPTPPAEEVHDVSGIVDNPAESGEESEDEWSYFKGDTANKENLQPSSTDAEVAQLTQSAAETEEMSSQLNPDAEEFVPVSPTRNIASPACQALINDHIISQSPTRYVGNSMNINVPSLQEFEAEVKSRPSEVEFNEKENGQKLSSQEIMANLLNGKNLDEIEFQPTNNTPFKLNDELFHFGPNATPITPKPSNQSEAFSTQAVFGDDTVTSMAEVLESSVQDFQSKEQDPMCASFYQEKEDEPTPFDLNKVQPLPDDVDELLNKSSDELIHKSTEELLNKSTEREQETPELSKEETDFRTSPLVTDLDKPSEIQEQKDLLSSPIASPQPEELPKSPEPSAPTLDEIAKPYEDSNVNDDFLNLQDQNASTPEPIESPQLLEDVCQKPESITPEPTQENLLAVSPLPEQQPTSTSPDFGCRLGGLSPAPEVQGGDFLAAKSPEVSDVERLESPAEDITSSVKDDVASPVVSPIPQEMVQESFERIGEETQLPAEPVASPVEQVLEEVKEAPQPEIISSEQPELKEDFAPIQIEPVKTSETISLLETSNLLDLDRDPSAEIKQQIENLIETCDIKSKITEEVPQPEIASAPHPEEKEFVAPTDQSTPYLAPMSDEIEFNSVATTDINSFLERSNLSEIESPLSALEQTQKDDSVIEKPKDTKVEEAAKPQEQPQASVEESKDANKELEAAAAAVAAAGAVAAVGAVAVAKSSKTGKTTTSAPKKPAAKPAPKTTMAKAGTVTKTALTTTSNASSRVSSTLSKTATASPKPKVPAARPSAEKKPLTNGEAKAPIRSTLTAKKVSDTSTSKSPTTKTAPPTKASLAKVESKVNSRPATAPPKPATITRTAPKTRPATLSARPTASSTAKATAPAAAASTAPKVPSANKTLSPPKPAAAPAKPRVPLARVPLTKTVTKNPEAEKQIKETVNKQLTTRTSVTARPASSRTSTTVKKTETKAPTTRTTTTTKTTITNLKSATKKPETITRTMKTKITKVEKPRENGISEEIKNVTTTETEERLVKDSSPVDSNLLLQSSNAD